MTYRPSRATHHRRLLPAGRVEPFYACRVRTRITDLMMIDSTWGLTSPKMIPVALLACSTGKSSRVASAVTTLCPLSP